MRLLATLALALAPVAVRADVPSVAVDIAPVHSLVAQVMDGLGEPSLLVGAGTSPHDHAMRPSEAAAIEDANLVVWVGEPLTPWLAAPLRNLARGDTLELLDVEGTVLLPTRAVHGANHAEVHAHGATDPHAWLDTRNGALWLDAVAEKLARLDPDNAETYRANAAAGRARIEAAEVEARALLAPRREMPFVVYHDAYQYLEARFGLPHAVPIAPGDAAPPGPAHVERVARHVADEGVACVFAEPQFSAGLVEAVAGDTGARAAILDPLAGDATPGPDLYPELIVALARTIADCEDM